MIATRIRNIPTGKEYMQYRLWLLQQIGIVSVGNWTIEDSSTLVFIHNLNCEKILAHLMRQLRRYEEMKGLNKTPSIDDECG